MKNFIKTHWPAIIATVLVSTACVCAGLTIANYWDYIAYTLSAK